MNNTRQEIKVLDNNRTDTNIRIQQGVDNGVWLWIGEKLIHLDVTQLKEILNRYCGIGERIL
jgi:hypothetical protein